MLKDRMLRLFLGLALLGVVAGVICGEGVALAASDSTGSPRPPLKGEEASTGERLELYTPYAVVSDISGKAFRYEIALIYEGTESKTFDLAATPLPGWTISIHPLDRSLDITQIRLQPGKKPPQGIRVTLEPMRGEVPEPGEYVIELTARSGNLEASIELKAVVTGVHEFSFLPESGRLNTDVAAGRENHLKASITNTGTTTISKIGVLAQQPEKWIVKFEPNIIENLTPGSSREIDITITPPNKTIAGDYAIKVGAGSNRYNTIFQLRATVLVPAIWRLSGILIVLATLAGVAVMYQRLAKR